MNAPGKGILKIVSIMYIIFGSIFALLMLLSLFLGSLLASWAGSLFGAFSALVGGLLFVAFLIPAAVDLIVGIIGFKNSDVPSKAQFYIVTGIVLTALTLILLMFSFTIWGVIMFAMPVLYIVGGYMNKNTAPQGKLKE